MTSGQRTLKENSHTYIKRMNISMCTHASRIFLSRLSTLSVNDMYETSLIFHFNRGFCVVPAMRRQRREETKDLQSFFNNLLQLAPITVVAKIWWMIKNHTSKIL